MDAISVILLSVAIGCYAVVAVLAVSLLRR